MTKTSEDKPLMDLQAEKKDGILLEKLDILIEGQEEQTDLLQEVVEKLTNLEYNQ